MEIFAKPGVGGIIEQHFNGSINVLIQERYKDDVPVENGLIEIPAGKIRAFESIYDCLRREIKEETGLDVDSINGEEESSIVEMNGYKVLNYSPFSSCQNIEGYYPIMVQVFICKVSGQSLQESTESKNIRWISLTELEELLKENSSIFYPMHVDTLRKYIKSKCSN